MNLERLDIGHRNRTPFIVEFMTAPQTELAIREFRPGDETAFRKLNEEWIVRYFALEPEDEAALQNPQEKILHPGGRIFFAALAGEIVGCCALKPIAAREYEVVKMAVAERHRGAGIGRRVLEAVIEGARTLRARRLYLETNHSLANAIHLYESVGFRHLPPERVVPSPYSRADVYMELYL